MDKVRYPPTSAPCKLSIQGQEGFHPENADFEQQMGLKSSPCLARQAAYAGEEAILSNSRDSATADQAPAKRCLSGRRQVTYRLVAERKKAQIVS